MFVQTDVPPPIAFGPEGEPVLVAAEGAATADLVTLLPMAEVATTAVPVDLPRARAIASGAPAGTFAIVHGPDAAPELTLVTQGEPAAAVEVGRVACADGAVPVAVVATGGGFLVASARSAAGSCDDGAGPPTVLQVVTSDAAGSRTTLGTIDGAAPVAASRWPRGVKASPCWTPARRSTAMRR